MYSANVTKINQQNAQINSGLICAFCWFIFVTLLKMHGPKKQNGTRLVKKSPIFYGTRRFITACTKPVYILSQINPVQVHPFHLLQSHFNINFPSTPRYSQWALYLTFPQ